MIAHGQRRMRMENSHLLLIRREGEGVVFQCILIGYPLALIQCILQQAGHQIIAGGLHQIALFIQRQLQKPDGVLLALLRVPYQNAEPGLVQKGVRVGDLCLFDLPECLYIQLVDSAAHVEQTDGSTGFAQQVDEQGLGGILGAGHGFS